MQSLNERELDPRLIWGIFIIGIINSLFFIYGHKIVIDSLQLLERGYLLTEGILVPFGPRSTNTNYIYGTFISLVSGLGIFVFKKAFGVAVIILLMQIVGMYLLAKTSFLRTNPSFFLCYLFFYWISPWRASEAFIWNASILFFTSALFVYSLDLLRKGKVDRGTFLHGMSYVLTFQTHNSVIIFAPISLYFLYKKEIKFSLKGILLNVLVFVLMIAPTVYLLLKNPSILNQNTGNAYLFKNLIRGGEAIKGVTYWLRYPSLYFGSTTLQITDTPWSEKTFWQLAWSLIKWILAGGSVLFVLWANIKFIKNYPKSFLKDLCKVTFISLVLISAMSPVSFNFWHLYLIYPFALIPLAWYFSTLAHYRRYLLLLGVYFFIYSLLSAVGSHKHSFDFPQDKFYKTHVVNNIETLIQKHKKISIKLN